jgi:hypothetical protein
MKISKQLFKIQVMIDQKPRDSVKHFSCLGNIIIRDARCIRELKSRIAITKEILKKQKALFTRKFCLNSRKKSVKCYTWRIASWVLKRGHFGKEIGNTWKVFKCCAGEGWRRLVRPIE